MGKRNKRNTNVNFTGCIFYGFSFFLQASKPLIFAKKTRGFSSK